MKVISSQPGREHGPDSNSIVELGVVIGKTGRDIPSARAHEHIAGWGQRLINAIEALT